MYKRVNKRGVTTQAVIISMIILLISGGVLFYFFSILPYRELIDKQACHQSVLLRSQSIAGIQPGQTLDVPINCKTQEIIISETNEERIKREIANQMYDCWWMLGKGKMDFFSESRATEWGVHKLETNCVICSIIKFDENLKEKDLKINMVKYLSETKIPKQNITYLEYFSDQTGVKLPVGFDVDAPMIETSKDYAIVYMGIKSSALWEPAVRDVGAILGTGFLFGSATRGLGGGFRGVGSLMKFLNPIKSISKAGAMSADGTSAVLTKTVSKAGLIALTAIAVTMIAQTGIAGWNQQIAAAHCDGSKAGCNMIVLTPLTAEEIAKVCQNIESIP